jgi:hypothetical protein
VFLKHFCSLKQKFLSQIDFSDILNFDTFSVAPSVINDKLKNVLFQFFSAKFQAKVKYSKDWECVFEDEKGELFCSCALYKPFIHLGRFFELKGY